MLSARKKRAAGASRPRTGFKPMLRQTRATSHSDQTAPPRNTDFPVCPVERTCCPPERNAQPEPRGPEQASSLCYVKPARHPTAIELHRHVTQTSQSVPSSGHVVRQKETRSRSLAAPNRLQAYVTSNPRDTPQRSNCTAT